MDEIRCRGHLNQFKHLAIDLGGIEQEFDLGYKFEFRQSNAYEVHPKTGIKAWAEPYLALYVSAYRFSTPEKPAATLHHALTRSKFAKRALKPGEADRELLLKLATSHLQKDLQVLLEDRTPTNLDQPRML